MSGLIYSDNEPRIHSSSGERVRIVLRHRDYLGAYVDARFPDGRVRRLHPAHVRPLTLLELLEWRRSLQ